MATKNWNEHRPQLAPYVTVKTAASAIEFYTAAFGAHELYRLTMPDGKLGHAELQIGDSRLMLSDEHPDAGALSPVSIGGTPVSLHLYVPDVDACVARAVSLGASVLRAVKDEFYGDRTGMVVDPFGHKWHLSTRQESVEPQEMQRRLDAMFE